MFQIAAFARLGGVSAKVLRDYDRRGLFRPVWVDAATGYRMYSPAQLPGLRRILALRDLGVSLDEIGALVGEGADLRPVLERRRASFEAARREVDRRLASLGISIAATERGVVGPDVVVRDVPAELVATLDVATLGGDIGGAFYELERAIRDAGVRAPRPPGLLQGERRDRGAESDGDGEGESDLEVFVPVRRAAPALATRRLPAVRAATALHHGPYSTLLATRAALDTWITAAGLVAGWPGRILYLQFGAESDLRLPRQYLVDRTADFVTEVQVPIA